MKPSQYELPEAWREALEDQQSVDLELAARLPALLVPEPASSGLERLVRAVATAPLRYAPFFGRVAELWDVPEHDVSAVFTQLQQPSSWKRTPLPGVRVIQVTGGPRTAGAETFLVRFAPGTRFPRHRHPGPEALLVLQGSYTDESGRVVAAGDLHEMAPGTAHGFLVAKNEPCIGAAVQHGREFTGPIMRVMQALFDRKR